MSLPSASRYQLRKEEPSSSIELSAYDALSRSLLRSRGIETDEHAQAFFTHEYARGLHDPFLLPDMEQAVERILRAIKGNERIAVYSDYDCDGIPGGVLMHDFFSSIGYTNFLNYIPHRHEEGYGLNGPAIEKLAQDGVTLMVTVDCGITDIAEVALARERGIDAIVTDHHEPGEVLPDAIAVINPKRTDNQYPFRELCGSGVAFKLVSALLSRGDFSLKAGAEKWWLDVVGLATIADMVPLVGENRLLAHYGLLVMRKNRRPGLQHLFRTMRMQAQTVSEDDIGFMIAPRINAASRMGTPEDAFRLLSARDEGEAGAFAKHLDRINNERKGVVGAMVKEIKRRLQGRNDIPGVLVIGDPSWRPALVGLAANSLAEEYARPVFVWGRDGRSLLKGSCRSDGATSVVELMHQVKDLLVEYGGHHASGGFSVKEECIHVFSERLNHAFRELGTGGSSDVSQSVTMIDTALTLDDVADTFRKIARFAPFGEGNPKPLFLFRSVSPREVAVFGKAKEHLRLTFATARGTLEAVAFFAPSALMERLSGTGPFDIVAHIEESYFMNRARLRLRIIEVGAPGSLVAEEGV